MTPYYQDKLITIYHGDMRQLLPRLPKVDAVITDPPYETTRYWWDQWPHGWPDLVAALTQQLWCFGTFRVFWEKHREFKAWRVAQDLVWEKHNGSSLHTDRFRQVHETLVHFYRGKWSNLYRQPVFTFDAEQRRVRRQRKPEHWGQLGSEGLYEVPENGPRLMRSVLFIRSCHHSAVYPAQKPEDLLKPLIHYTVPPGGLVLDPFMGSGATLKVARQLGRRAIGIDQNREACQIAAS